MAHDTHTHTLAPHIVCSWIDSVYWASITVATVGYGDQTPNTWEGRLFAVFYIFFGTLLTAHALSKIVSIPMNLRHRSLENKLVHQFGDTLNKEEFVAIRATVKVCVRGDGYPTQQRHMVTFVSSAAD